MLSPAPLPLAALVLKALALPKAAPPSPMPADAAVGPFVAALAAASAVRGNTSFAARLPAREPADRRKREQRRGR